MSRFMRALGLCLGSCLLVSQVASASIFGALGGCDDDCWFGGSFAVGAEALFWKPSTGGFDYVAAATQNNESVRTIEPDYDWGFRIGGLYRSESGCSYAALSGLYFHSRDHATTRGDHNLIPAFLQEFGPSRVDAGLKYDYWNIDLKVGQYVRKGCGIDFHVFGGVRYADLSEKQFVSSSGGQSSLNAGVALQQGDLHAIGPQVGLGGEYCIWRDFSLFGSANVLALFGERKTRWDGTTNLDSVTKRNRFESEWTVVPAVDTRVGVSYVYKCDCWWVRGELGYELNHYWNAINRVTPFGSFNDRDRRSHDVGFGGMFLGLSVGF